MGWMMKSLYFFVYSFCYIITKTKNSLFIFSPCCWLGSRKGIWPVKNWVVGCWHGYLPRTRCRLAYGPADATASHYLFSCFSKIQIGFTFLVPAHLGSPGKKAACVWYGRQFISDMFCAWAFWIMMTLAFDLLSSEWHIELVSTMNVCIKIVVFC